MPRVEMTVCERCGRLFTAAPGVHVCPRCNPPPIVRQPVDLDQFADGDEAKKCPRCGRRYFGHRKLCMRCLSPRGKFMRICRHCGKHFAASSNHFLVCPKCRKERLAAYMKDYMPRWREAHGKTTCNGGSLAPRKDGD